jgi:hypothetical protein
VEQCYVGDWGEGAGLRGGNWVGGCQAAHS